MLYLEARIEQGSERWRLQADREYVIGRGADCDVVLDDPSVSRRHVSLTIQGNTIRLHDLGSTNGVWVAGERVIDGEVATEQWFAIGTLLMVVREGITFAGDSGSDPESPVGSPAGGAGGGEIDGAPRGNTPPPADSVSLDAADGPSWARELADLIDASRGAAPLLENLLGWIRELVGADGAAVVRRAEGAWVVDCAVGRDLPGDLPAGVSEPDVRDRASARRMVVEGRELSLLPLGGGGRTGWLVLAGAKRVRPRDPALSLAAGLLWRLREPAPVSQAAAASPVPGGRVLQEETGGTGDALLVVSERMRSLVRQVDRLARSDLPVFLHGETGTGKELLARRLHARSARRNGPFVVINCAALPHDLLEAELFGIETGVATGVSARQGKFSLASGGTLFLDEVGDLPDTLQPKLLRALESGEIAPLGAPSPVAVDVRIVAASHQDLEEKIRRGAYRRDLLYRLAGAIVRVPPLRERPEEVLPMARHFARELSRSRGVPFEGLSMPAAQALLGYSWPGNVRELRHAVARAVALSDGSILGLEVLPEEVGGSGDAAQGRVYLGLSKGFKQARRDFERVYLQTLLDRCRGNVTEASRRAGLSRSSFYRKLEELGLRQEEED